MKVLLAPDKFRGAFSAHEVAELLAQGIRETAPKATLVIKPVFDGGEGTADALAGLMSMDSRTVACENIAGQSVNATVYWLGARRLALIECSQVLRTELPWTRDDFLRSSSWVLGKLIQRALELRPKELWLACGGTLTADGGWGAACCFGIDACDSTDRVLEPSVANMSRIASVKIRGQNTTLERTALTMLCDVNAPLAAPGGVSLRSFFSQKGAAPEDHDSTLAGVLKWQAALHSAGLRTMAPDAPFGGAAGGIALGLGAVAPELSCVAGAQVFMRIAAMRAAMSDASLVVCGEGRLDESTLYGKSPFAVAQMAKELHVPVAGVFGDITDPRLSEALGLRAVHVLDGPSKDSDARGETARRERLRLRRLQLVDIGRSIGRSLLSSQASTAS